MRYMLYECNERRVPLIKEVNYIKNYLDLERLRQGGEIDIQFAVEGEIKDQTISPLMFIPFIENSFKHGINKQLNEGFVHLFLTVTNEEVVLRIKNSKPELVPLPGPKRSGGIGLVNVKRRLNLLYPGKYDLDINEEPNAYEVLLRIDIN